MKRKIIFGVLCLLSMISFVKAEDPTTNSNGDETLNEILKDGSLYIDTFAPFEDGSPSTSSITDVIKRQYSQQLRDTAEFKAKNLAIGNCSSDFKTCDVTYYSMKNGAVSSQKVTANIIWKEDSLDSYSEDFKKIAPNGVINLNSFVPTNEYYSGEWYDESSMVNSVVEDYVKQIVDKYHTDAMCNIEKSKCVLTIKIYEGNTNMVSYKEEHIVKVNWASYNKDVKQLVDKYVVKVKDLYNDSKINKTLIDLSVVNYYLHNKNVNFDNLLNYEPNTKSIFDNPKLSYKLYATAGTGDDFDGSAWGGLLVSYDGTIISGTNYGVGYKNIIYIPDETENTPDAFIAAAKKRIDAYVGNDSVKIKVLKAFKDYEYINSLSYLCDITKAGDYYYNVIINDEEHPFIILKDSSKISNEEKVETVDYSTNIKVETTSSEVPLDTVVKVQEVKEESEVFTNIKKVLKINNVNDVMVFDIKLFSSSLNEYISKLSNGEFKVSIPIKDSLKGKELVAYYVDGNNVEEHPVTIVDDMATFKTTHFTVYTIMERQASKKLPNTYDNITSYIIFGLFGVALLIVSLLMLKKRKQYN